MFHSYDLSAYGKKLREIRTALQLTQNDIRNLAGLNENTLRKIEGGLVIPKYETLETLSSIYKVDTFSLLIQYRSHHNVETFYQDMDRLLLLNKASDLTRIKAQLLDQSKALAESLISKKDLELLLLFIEVAEKYYSFEAGALLEAEAALEKALRLASQDNKPSAVDLRAYSLIERRLLLQLALVKSELSNQQDSLSILHTLLEGFDQSFFFKEEFKLKVKIYLNISYNYHLINQWEPSLKYALEGIEYNLRQESLYCLYALYARKAVAEFRLSLPGHLDSFKKCYHLLEISGDTALTQQYVDITLSRYNIDMRAL